MRLRNIANPQLQKLRNAEALYPTAAVYKAAAVCTAAAVYTAVAIYTAAAGLRNFQTLKWTNLKKFQGLSQTPAFLNPLAGCINLIGLLST